MTRRFHLYLLPGIVFQSVLIGGAYGTGREIVEYGARFGRHGLFSLAAIFLGFTVISGVSFEFARVHRTYDYRGFVRRLIGPLWPLFDVVFLVMIVVIIAVVSAASGEVLKTVLNWPSWIGFVLVLTVVACLNVLGRHAIERFKTAGTAVLYGGYCLFAGAVLYRTWGGLGDAFEVPPEVPAAGAFGAGMLYVGYNLAVLPTTLFVLDRLDRRRQAVVAGVVTGLLATVPFALTYLAVMASYPDADVLEAPVPWLVLLERHAGPAVLAIFALVLLWTLVETCTGLIHAVIDRISGALRESGREPLSARQAGLVTVTVLLGAALLSRIGLIGLVARGYTAMAYAFLLLFALPLLTRGLFLIGRASVKKVKIST